MFPGICDSVLYLVSSSNQARFCSQLGSRFVHVLPFALSLFVSGIICLFASLDGSPLYLFPFAILVYQSHGALSKFNLAYQKIIMIICKINR